MNLGRSLRCSAVVTVFALLSGCSSAPAQRAGPDATDRLTIAVPQDFGPLNIFASHDEPLTELVYDKLLAPSPYVRQPQPWLATAVRQVDATNWDVQLRGGVRWQDGQPFTSTDVAFTIAYFKTQAITGRWTHHVSDVPTIASAVPDGPLKIRLTCAYACPELGTVTLADIPIIPEHVWRAVPGKAAKQVQTLPIGTGPYRLVSYSPTTGYRFEANADYFAGRPQVRELRMPIVKDPTATFTALRSGEIDAADRPLPPELVDQFSRDSQIKVIKTSALQFPELVLNFDRAPFDRPELRRALSLAINRQQMLDVVALGKGRAATKGYPHPDAPFADPTLSTPYDPGEARALLDRLGFTDANGDGVRDTPTGPMRYSIAVDGALPVDVRAAQLVEEDLRAVGIATPVRPVDGGSLAAMSTSRDFDLRLDTITAHGVADPDQFVMSHRSGYLWRSPSLPYPAWDALFARWKAAGTLGARAPVLRQMQQLFNNQPTAIPLYYPDEYWAVRSGRYSGWVESPGYGIVHKWSLLPAQVGRRADAVVVR